MTVKDGIVPIDENAPIKAKRAATLQQTTRIARFKGSVIIEQNGKWHEMNSDRFAEACYRQFGFGINKSTIADLEHLFRTTAQDLSDRAHLIDFGGAVWNMKKLDWDQEVDPKECVYRVDWQPIGNGEPIKFIMDLAKGDKGVYDDIMQSCAPIIMDKKPTGVIWYLGGGANGKSTLVHLLYKIFGPYLTEITVKQLEDERDTPQLNGKLANICKESSEGFVEDTRTYKSIGTHENFSVHKFHSQDMVEIEGNVHHIFSANNIPTFGDKSYGARRRTLVIPFQNQFPPDEMFEEKTFTDGFVERFIAELIKYAHQLKEQKYEYQFSNTTHAMKEKYDTDANTAQTYADELVSQDIKAFTNYNTLRMDYENWCLDHGYKPSSINVLRRAMDDKGFERKSVRDENNRVAKMYAMTGSEKSELVKVTGRLGLYQTKGSTHELDVLGAEEKQQMLGNWTGGNK